MAKSLGLTTSLDTQWDPAERWDFDYANILPHVDIFLPNEAEIKHITEMNNLDDAINALHEFCNILVVKNGSRGSTIFHNGQVTHVKPFLNTSVVDAIGAGDSFNAGFIFKFIQNNSLDECHQFGNLMGAVSTTRSGGTTAFDNYESVMEIARTRFNYND
jgi:sugar/nucleoside kinase (ribokinase family)